MSTTRRSGEHQDREGRPTMAEEEVYVLCDPTGMPLFDVRVTVDRGKYSDRDFSGSFEATPEQAGKLNRDDLFLLSLNDGSYRHVRLDFSIAPHVPGVPVTFK